MDKCSTSMVIQKEANGIYYSCMYLESLLRDRHSTIRTDHLNLLFIKQSSNRMIFRWYMAFSEFIFTVEFISGQDDDVADSTSRFCRNIAVSAVYTSKEGLRMLIRL